MVSYAVIFGPRLRIRDPVFFLPLDPRSVVEKNPEPGSWIRDEHPGFSFENLVSVFWVKNILTFFDADPDPGSCQPWIRDGKNRIQDKDKHPGSTTLMRSPTEKVTVSCSQRLLPGPAVAEHLSE